MGSITNLTSDSYMMSQVVAFSEVTYPSIQINKINFNTSIQSNSVQSQKMYPDSYTESDSEHNKNSEQNSINSINNDEVLEVFDKKTDNLVKVEVSPENIENSKLLTIDINHLKE